MEKIPQVKFCLEPLVVAVEAVEHTMTVVTEVVVEEQE